MVGRRKTEKARQCGGVMMEAREKKKKKKHGKAGKGKCDGGGSGS